MTTSDSEEEVVRRSKRRKTPQKIIDETPDGDSDLEDLNSDPDTGNVVDSQQSPERHKAQERDRQRRANVQHHHGERDSDLEGDGEVDGQEEEDDEIPTAGTIGQVEFRPEYDRDEDGYAIPHLRDSTAAI